jgi:hypothetical protein
MNLPDDSPLLSGSADSGDAAAFAAMQADWAAIEGFVMHDCEEENDGTALRRAELMRDFLAKHRAVLEDRGMPPAMLDPQPMLKSEEDLRRACGEMEQLEDKLLQAKASLAETAATMAEQLLGRWHWLENLSDADWESLEPAPRANLMDALLNLRNNRETLLGRLPVEKRREWEAKLPPFDQ